MATVAATVAATVPDTLAATVDASLALMTILRLNFYSMALANRLLPEIKKNTSRSQVRAYQEVKIPAFGMFPDKTDKILT